MVPNGWEVKKLNELCEINPKKPSKPSDELVSFISMSQISEDGQIISTETKTYDEVSKGFTSFKDKDVLVAKITPCFENGKGALAHSLVNGIGFGSTEFHVLRAKKITDPKFIYYLTRTNAFRAKGTMNMQGSAGHRRVTTDFIKVYKINTPPLLEQQKIAKILSTWDKAISTTERLIENSTQQKKALMQQLLTGKKRLLDDEGKQFEGEWNEVKLSSLAKSGKGNFTDGDWIESPHITEDGCRLIQTGNIGVGYFKNKNKRYISETSFNELKCTEVKVGDLLICRLAEPAGRACVVPDIGEEKMLTSVDVAIMNVDEAKSSANYLSYYFSLEHTLYLVSALCGGSTRSRVSRTNLGTMKILIPSVIEQQKIATVLTNADKEIELLEQQLADLQQEKNALMQVLLTGKKRVVVDGDI